MSGTIETTNNIICKKISSLAKIIDLFEEINFPINKKIKIELSKISSNYELGSTKILANYYILIKKYNGILKEIDSSPDQSDFFSTKKKYSEKKIKCFNQYENFIKNQNFGSKLDRLYNMLKNIININIKKFTISSNIEKFKKYSNMYDSNTIKKEIKYINFDICSNCFSKMSIVSNMSIIECKQCGLTENLYGTVFEDEQFYYQEGQRTKHGSYDPSKHCKFWVERIQAREATEIPTDILKKIKSRIFSYKIYNIEDVTCEFIRKILRELQLSKYNEHVPLIRKLITGITPPQLTDYELQLIYIYFDKVIKIYDKIKPVNKTNCFYHPYFIFKIIEHILKDNRRRLRDIIYYIHLQSRETLIKNDRIWRKICDEIEEITYIPTDKNIYF